MLTLREMQTEDLGLVTRWLQAPHVAKWYVTSSTADEIEDIRRSVTGEQPTHILVVEDDGRPIGWCQWYLLSDYPDYASDVDARAGEIGIDYAIGDPTCIGRGFGTKLIDRLFQLIREIHPGAGFVADPFATNQASRRVLEKNGFRLFDQRPVPSDGADAQMAVYRLP
ncbi:MAG: GNAT family N-acetyltransferase [Acidimicrobiales bacterium]